MYEKNASSWLKHLDFNIIDILSMQISYIVAYMLRHGRILPYDLPTYRTMAIILILLHILVASIMNSYSGILRRGHYKEFVAVIKHVTIVIAIALVYLFLTQKSADYSRVTFLLVWVLNVLLSWICRSIRKILLISRAVIKDGKRSLIVVTSSDKAEIVMQTLKDNKFEGFFVSGLAIMDKDWVGKEIEETPVVINSNNILEYLKNNWVDEVFIDLSSSLQEAILSDELLTRCLEMGITVHTKLAKIAGMSKNQVVESFAGYTVLSSSIAIVSPGQLFIKRVIDIIGGLVGCVITFFISLFIAPIIFIKSPGPIFFTQTRVGKSGRQFNIYKFRSMHVDAEERKQELMELNKVKDGYMFKIDDDPRIIPGIGHFIRRHSIDEFPQFFNVLKGDMSLVGTRPPTLDEWNKYELHHRKRLAIKPGLTGLWQVSGRSNITDFEEVVALDSKYISEWNLGMDMRIILKTIKIVLNKDGSV